MDIRLDSGFPDHPKTIKMINRLGPESVSALLRLWGWAAKHRPKGILKGMNPEDIGIAAKWADGEQFVAALVEVKFLDKRGNGLYKLHDWEEHQPFVFWGPERSEKAKIAAKAKRAKKDKDLDSAQTEIPLNSNEDLGQPETDASTTPSPTPIPPPSPNPKPREEKSAAGKTVDPHDRIEIKKLFEYFNQSEWRYVLDGMGPYDWLANLYDEFGLEVIEVAYPDQLAYYKREGIHKPLDPLKARGKVWENCQRHKVGGFKKKPAAPQVSEDEAIQAHRLRNEEIKSGKA